MYNLQAVRKIRGCVFISKFGGVLITVDVVELRELHTDYRLTSMSLLASFTAASSAAK